MREFIKPTLSKLILFILLITPFFLITSALKDIFGVCKLGLPFCIYVDCEGFPVGGDYICTSGLQIDGIIANILLYAALYLVACTIVFFWKLITKRK